MDRQIQYFSASYTALIEFLSRISMEDVTIFRLFLLSSSAGRYFANFTKSLMRSDCARLINASLGMPIADNSSISSSFVLSNVATENFLDTYFLNISFISE